MIDEMKVINLFGRENHIFKKPLKTQKGLFDDYEGFVDKFKPKLTTDDCYTPPAVYDCIVDYVRENCDIEGAAIVARKLNRHFAGCDLNPEYVGIAERRLRNEIGLFV